MSEIHEMPLEELATPGVLRRARTALAAPNAEVLGVELYPDVPSKAAALAGAILANPPLPDHASRLACQALRGYLRRNGHGWAVSIPATILRFDAERRTDQIGADLAEWIAARVEPVPAPRRAVARGELRLFAPDEPPGPHVVYLAGPLSGLADGDRTLLERLGSRIEQAVAEVTERGAVRQVLQLDHPSVRLSPERTLLSAREIWTRNRAVILGQADALIVTDVGMRAAGVGAAMEIDLMAQEGGPILYLRTREVGSHSRYLLGRGEELDLTVLDCDGPDEAASEAREWLTVRSNAIEETGRCRADRIYEKGFLLRRLAPTYRAAEPDRRRFIEGVLRISPAALDAALSEPALADALLRDRLATLSELLGQDKVSREPLGLSLDDEPDAAGLLEAGPAAGLEPEEMLALWHRGCREYRAVRGVARRALRTRADWMRYAQES